MPARPAPNISTFDPFLGLPIRLGGASAAEAIPISHPFSAVIIAEAPPNAAHPSRNSRLVIVRD